ncbi:SEC-C domain-containing protein [Luteibacter jiangsuensis]|uniref:SEC-C domain-containing protein n=1 Tax=Luteibacter jiangsuensis TaxID=637577 RepID=A0ABX0Q9W8_9GAMM|nr:SEC-C metal-binding domain-containing protein [Luteibacter jiangsuensis]NID07031.1 SEC-C domain-containing protein [Luteibacter jiangsuensis]
MTIILAIGNARQVVQFSDRRLSAAGKIVNEHANKATVFTCSNARLAVGFTGLATSGDFNMQRWLVEALDRLAPPEFTIYEVCCRLANELTHLFKTSRWIRGLLARDRRLSVFLSGYLHNRVPPELCNIIVTNYQNYETGEDSPDALPDFWNIFSLQSGESLCPTYVQRTGAWGSMTSRDESILRSLLLADASVETLISAGVGLIREMAKRPAAHGTIGQEVQLTVIPSDPAEVVTARVRSSDATDTLVLTDQVIAIPGESFAVQGIQIHVHDATDGFRPKLGRNDRCWCASGLKFKRCHGARR